MNLKYFLFSTALCLFTACGGGGGSDPQLVEEALREPPATVGTITDFLWKPQSDAHSRSPGTLAVLASACNAEVRVNGIALVDSGPSNGRCTTARGSEAGCTYGVNVKVEVIDRATGLPYAFPTGDPFYMVTNGCVREQFKQ